MGTVVGSRGGGEGRGGEGQHSYSYEYSSRPRFTHGTVQYAGRDEERKRTSAPGFQFPTVNVMIDFS